VDYLLDKPSEVPRVTQNPELCSRRVLSNCLDEYRPALTAIRYKPTPEVGALARSPGCSPSAADEREVQKNDRIRRSKPDFDNVVGTQIPLYDPGIFRDKLLLHGHPLIARCWNKAHPPEDFVKLDDREPGDLAQAPRESGFA